MLLNIYLISHPIVRILSNSTKFTTFTSQTQFEYQHKYLGLFLLYEILRKYIYIKNLYIKKISYVKEISKINTYKKCLIITNLIKTHKLISDIKILIPEIEVIHVEEYENFNNKDIINIYKNSNVDNTIILDTIIYNTDITSIIKFLIEKCQTNTINIACLACYNYAIEEIGKQYPKLNIYTTKII